jgi:hypothetical protein
MFLNFFKKKFKPNKNFWQDLKKSKIKADGKAEPILVMAPMADVTDLAFRKMFAKYGKPDVMWTEFVSADGLALAPKEGRETLLKDLRFDSKIERPIIAQIFSSNPEYMKQAAQLVEELGFDGLDINMGCPANKIEKQLERNYQRFQLNGRELHEQLRFVIRFKKIYPTIKEL